MALNCNTPHKAGKTEQSGLPTQVKQKFRPPLLPFNTRGDSFSGVLADHSRRKFEERNAQKGTPVLSAKEQNSIIDFVEKHSGAAILTGLGITAAAAAQNGATQAVSSGNGWLFPAILTGVSVALAAGYVYNKLKSQKESAPKTESITESIMEPIIETPFMNNRTTLTILIIGAGVGVALLGPIGGVLGPVVTFGAMKCTEYIVTH